MPSTEITAPETTSAVHRLTLATQEVRGTNTSQAGGCGCCIPFCCGCFDADSNE